MGFSDEAIRMLLTEVESHRTEVLVVLAGYKDKMAELMKADPGLARRFPKSISLPDYTADEIAAIAKMVAKERFGTPLADGVQEKLARWLEPRISKMDAAGHNGGLA